MNLKFLTVFVFVGCIAVYASASDITLNQDTYVDAFQNSHKTEFDFNGGGYQYNPTIDNNYLPPAPSSPHPIYGQPPIYNSPPSYFYKPPHPIPYHSHDNLFWEKLKSKINIYTLGKIILKLLIFKKILKFIGVIFLLLVLPKLKNLFSENMTVSDEGINSKHVETDKEKLQKQINEIYELVISSIQDFEEEHT